VSEEIELEWRAHAIIAILLISNSLIIGFTFRGPWDDPSFTRGIFGLVGLGFAYVAWFRATFKTRGLIPWLDLWKNPIRSAKQEMFAAIVVLTSAWLTGNSLKENLPDPTGLIIALIGLLLLIQSIYALLSLSILKDE